MRKWCYIALLLGACSETHQLPESGTSIEWVTIPAGQFIFGTDDGPVEQGPGIPVELKAFQISATEVTNAQFTEFVNETGYITDAERLGEGTVFRGQWEMMSGANWQHPMGPDSSIDTLDHHPVVLVSYRDAQSYAAWAGGRLPTEVEWEYAGKLGHDAGAEKNIWTGIFPKKNSRQDGYEHTAPVNAYQKDKLGLAHMQGNVWEWCADLYNFEVHDKWKYARVSESLEYVGASFDPTKSGDDTLHVIKGGSFMCHADHCRGYEPSARQSASQNEAFFHIGFRIVKN